MNWIGLDLFGLDWIGLMFGIWYLDVFELDWIGLDWYIDWYIDWYLNWIGIWMLDILD